MAINANKEIKKFKSTEDNIADKIGNYVGSMSFVYLHAFWFGAWALLNLGVFGASMKFDKFPFDGLALAVSLEAIFLSTFVMISQNRQAYAAEIRSELDYQTDVKAEHEIDIIMKTLQRVAAKQGVKVDDLIDELVEARKLPGVHK